MTARAAFRQTDITRAVKAARAADPAAVVEIVTPGAIYRILPADAVESAQPPETPAADAYDNWQAKRRANDPSRRSQG